MSLTANFLFCSFLGWMEKKRPTTHRVYEIDIHPLLNNNNWIMAGQRPETIRWTCYLPLYADWFEVWTKCTHCWPITICHPICVCSSMGYFMGRAELLKEKVRKLLNVGEWVHRKDITLQWQMGDLSGKEKHTGGVEVKKGGQEIENSKRHRWSCND